ncbi:MAG: Sec-independent protein translocase protein TatB [Parasulfuritortus sp.]|jgi:sec-independent protein translocase protein TatB|nr:Sec-independent protein translocase protein TatB [Parasulfuritortus sp.]
MFGIGFSELLLIGVVALIVIGPERLPKVARTAGAWIGRLNRYTAQIKADINREMHLDELRSAQQSMKDSVQKYEIMAEEASQKVKQEAGDMHKAVQAVTDDIASDPNAQTIPVEAPEHKAS